MRIGIIIVPLLLFSVDLLEANKGIGKYIDVVVFYDQVLTKKHIVFCIVLFYTYSYFILFIIDNII